MALHRFQAQWIALTEDNFRREVLNSRIPVLVDCWASWCTALQQINPVSSGIVIDFSRHVKFGRIDIAIAEEWATCYSIRAVPTLLLFREGEVIERVIGGLSETDLNHKLTRLIALKPMGRSYVSCLQHFPAG